MVKQVADLAGQIRGMGSQICQNKRVLDLAGGCGGLWRSALDFDVVAFNSDVITGDVAQCRWGADPAGFDIKDGTLP